MFAGPTPSLSVELIFEDTIVSDSFGNEVPSYGQNGQVSIGALGDINADGHLDVVAGSVWWKGYR